MRSLASLAVINFTVSLVAACTKNVPQNSAATRAFRTSSAPAAARMFERRGLDVVGFRHLNEFIRPDVRERLDVEPIGESDEYIPPTSIGSEPSSDGETQEPFNEEDPLSQLESTKAKFQWAKKKYGDALAADPTATGYIVLYADENYYDIGRLNYFVDEGRGIIALESGIEPTRMQVIYGGYRGVAQVEMWIVPDGQQLPELKPESRDEQPTKEL